MFCASLSVGAMVSRVDRGLALTTLFFAVAALSTTTPLTAEAADEKPTLASCSLRYGSLMVDHWLTVDVVRQIERGLFYHPGSETVQRREEFEKLRRSVI